MTVVRPLPTPDAPRFRLYSERDLGALPPPEWLLERHLPQGCLSVLYGAPGSGKSFLVLDWAMRIASGQPWLGHAARQGAVVYIAAEGAYGLTRRLQAYRDANEFTATGDVWFVPETVNLLDDSEVDALLREIPPQLDERRMVEEWPLLWVVDTMARSMPDGDENSAKDVGLVIAAVDRIRRTCPAASILLVHHTGKSGDAERGSSALRAAADAMFSLKNEDGVLTLENTKQKDAPLGEPRRLRLAPVGESCVIEPLEQAVLAPKMTATGWKMLRTLFESFQSGESPVTVWLRVSGIPEPSFYRTLKHLLELHYVDKQRGKYIVTTAGEQALRSTLTELSTHSHESRPVTSSHPGGPIRPPGESEGRSGGEK